MEVIRASYANTSSAPFTQGWIFSIHPWSLNGILSLWQENSHNFSLAGEFSSFLLSSEMKARLTGILTAGLNDAQRDIVTAPLCKVGKKREKGEI